jgi:uncharacterized protein
LNELDKSEIILKEFKPINIEGGYVIDGLPSAGITNTIATESLMSTAKFELAGYLDSDSFPALAIMNEGLPNHPTNIFVNHELKTAIFISQLNIPDFLHRIVANLIINWAKEHKCSLVISSIPHTSSIPVKEKVVAAVSTEEAKSKLKKADIPITSNAIIPGIPGQLLVEGRYSNQNVVVLAYNPENQKQPDFKSGAKLCEIMSKLIPGTSCNVSYLEQVAEKIENDIKKTKKETKSIVDTMYR